MNDTNTTSVFILIWNNEVVFTELDEHKFVDYLKNKIGMDDQFIEDNIDQGPINVSFDPKCDDEDFIIVTNWKQGPDRGDDYVTIQLVHSIIGEQ